jgi:3-hydroxybutyryl-CoA dehydratase
MPAYLEDLEPGAEFRSAGRTITESDIMAFAGVSGDFNRLHTDEPWVRDHTPFRGRIAHGLLVLSISSGLATPGLDELEVIAYLEETRRFTGPTYPGDTIHAEWRVTEVRPSSSRPTTGVVTLDVEIRNDRGEAVQSGRDVWLVARRPEDA